VWENVRDRAFATFLTDEEYEHDYRAELAAESRLPLATPVRLCNGVEATISGHSTASATSYRVSWFDRWFWRVHHKWVERGDFEVTGSAAAADNSPASAA